MKLVDMKRSKKDREKTSKPSLVVGDDYGYGLRLRLDKEELKKLELDLPKVGDTFEIHAIARVCSVSQNEGEYSNKNVELQVRKIGLEKQSKSMADAVRSGISEADEE